MPRAAAPTTYTWPHTNDNPYDLNTNLTDIGSRANALERAQVPWAVGVDSFTGATDELKLTAALSYAAAQTYPPFIMWSNQSYSYTSQRTVYDGMRFCGPPGIKNPESAGGNPATVDTLINLNIGGSNPWLVVNNAGNNFDVCVRDLSFIGTSATSFIGSTSGGLYQTVFYNCAWQKFVSVFGSAATKLNFTNSYWDRLHVNGTYSYGAHIGGSDNTFCPSGGDWDSGTAYVTTNGMYHIWGDGLEKTTFGPIYFTCEAKMGGYKNTGHAYNSGGSPSNLAGPVYFYGTRFEGRNAGAGCNGSVVRFEGGHGRLTDCWVSYGMISPSTPGHSPADGGLVHVDVDAAVALNGCVYDRATGVAETVPWVYVDSGGRANVTQAWIGDKGGAWTGLPRVKDIAAGGSPAVITDASVTVI